MNLLNSKVMNKNQVTVFNLCRFSKPGNNGKQNPEESYTNKYQKHIACSYGYKLACVDDKFSKPFETYIGEDAVFDFINRMIEDGKYCSDVMKNHLTKNL